MIKYEIYCINSIKLMIGREVGREACRKNVMGRGEKGSAF